MLKKFSRKNKKNKKLFKHFKEFYLAESIFNKWLNENMDRFINKPIKKADGGFYFEGIIKNIYLEMDFRLPEAMILFDDSEGNNFDIYPIQYIGSEKYNPQKGFYDADRTDNIYTYFSTREGLYINEVFEPIIEYCNKMFLAENSLYLGDLDGVTVGFISSSDENNNKEFQKFFFNAIQFRNSLVGEDGKKIFNEMESYKYLKYGLFENNKRKRGTVNKSNF